MMGRTHLLAGLAVGLLATKVQALPPNDALFCVALAGLSSLLPDIDTPTSTLGRRLKLLAWLIPSHRGITHSLLIWLLFSALMAYVAGPHSPFWLFASGGYLSHLILDMLTAQGIPLLYPLKFRFRLLGIRTGGWMEFLFVVIFGMGTIYLSFSP